MRAPARSTCLILAGACIAGLSVVSVDVRIGDSGAFRLTEPRWVRAWLGDLWPLTDADGSSTIRPAPQAGARPSSVPGPSQSALERRDQAAQERQRRLRELCHTDRTAGEMHVPGGGDATPMRDTRSGDAAHTLPETGDAPLRAGHHPVERASVSDIDLHDVSRELAIWYDPAQFPSGPIRFAVSEGGPASVLTVGGDPAAVRRARLDGKPVVPGRSYPIDSGMRFEAPGPLDLQIRPAKPSELPSAPQGAG
jgi:hypothetical protein